MRYARAVVVVWLRGLLTVALAVCSACAQGTDESAGVRAQSAHKALACAPGTADCDGNAANGCETNIDSNTSNCGGCGLACSGSNMGSVACAGGVCTGTCAGGWADCNGNKQTDGCEINVNSNTSHCGGCGNVCSTNHVPAPACGSGQCVGSCATGWGDCNADKLTDGCEVNLNTDAANCSWCGGACSANHITTAVCNSGVCGGNCSPGYSDCNANKRNDGCEVFVAGTDIANCGGCGTVCSANNTTPSCGAGVCTSTCLSGYANCDGNIRANGCEVDITDNVSACGGCGLACSSIHVPIPQCTGTSCTGACASGWMDCDGNKQSNGCEAAFSSATSCGGCGNVCSTNHIATPTCSGSGFCDGTCNSGWADCNNNKLTDGCERDIASSPTSCGGCNLTCSANHITTPECSSQQCTGTCDAGWADCNANKRSDGCERDVATDLNNCGGCNLTCSTNNLVNRSCTSGVCDGNCVGGWADCNGNKQADGCEVHIASNAGSCGACGAACSTNHVPVVSCTTGSCDGACAAGWGDCNGNKRTDGCETSLTTATDCGACGVSCTNAHGIASCSTGVCVPTCDGGYADCDGNPNNGCETNIAIDVTHCGGCGQSCSATHVPSPSCSAGSCVGACESGFADCNVDKLTDGCEVDLSTTSNCGACGVACTNVHGTTACVAAACAPSCEAGWGNCDGNANDGCETSTSADVTNCGACFASCSTNHISTPACTGGECVGSCATGWHDCNADKLTDGCERSTSSDPLNCGGCGVSCSSSHVATPICVASVCTGACDAGFADCNGDKQSDGCETNTQTELAHCGACGQACSNNHLAARVCTAGVCGGACDSAWGDCNGDKRTDGCETSLATVTDCGACGVSCSNANGSTSCLLGACVPVCSAGYADCDGNAANGCETNTDTSATHCGGCGGACSSNHVASPTCAAGVCAGACAAGYDDCNADKRADGCETSLATVTNCGACGVSCNNAHGTSACLLGVCTPSCDAGWANCDGVGANGCETSTDASALNCGACGAACSTSHTDSVSCEAGACRVACTNGWDDCNGDARGDGCETDLRTIASCGACGVTCTNSHGSTACTAGACQPSCSPGFASCDADLVNGCETNTTADAAHCGACASACSTSNVVNAGCAAGECTGTCAAGWADCNDDLRTDGCEASLGAVTSCGACGVVCMNAHGSSSCVSGSCAPTCTAGFDDCDGNPNNGCESSLASPTSCGACGQVCVALDQCHDVGTCDPAIGTCSDPVKPGGAPCDDGRACTSNDTCQAGVCTAGTDACACSADADCVPIDACHTTRCDVPNGLCVTGLVADGTACDDADLCTSGESCQGGVCGWPSFTVTCTAADACHDPGSCDALTGSCSSPAKPAGTACSDDRSCTSGDSCVAGVCTPAQVNCACTADADCVPLDSCHRAGVCALSTGLCSYPAEVDGTPCDDGDACTSGETCQAGACGAPALTVVCPPIDGCHLEGACDAGSGECSRPLVPDGEACVHEGSSGACRLGVCVVHDVAPEPTEPEQPAPDGGSAGGCACSDGPGTSAFTFVLMLLLGGVCRRRRGVF